MSQPISGPILICVLLVAALVSIASFGVEVPTNAAEAERQANADLDVMARELAKLASSPGFRGFIRSEIAKSKNREKILELDRFLERASRPKGAPPGLRKFRDFSQQARSRLDVRNSDLKGYDLYIPVDAHRAKWKGGDNVVVAFAPVGDDQKVQKIVAYSVKTGQQVLLDARTAPEVLVLMLSPDEHDTHQVVENPAPVVQLPNIKPHEVSADPEERPVDQEAGNSYVGVKYLWIKDIKEWWWQGDPEIYMWFHQKRDTDCREKSRWLSEVNRSYATYNLWTRSSPARFYFNSNYATKMRVFVWERDGGYDQLHVTDLYNGVTCESTYRSDDDQLGAVTMYRNNFTFNYDYYQNTGAFGPAFGLYWRKEH